MHIKTNKTMKIHLKNEKKFIFFILQGCIKLIKSENKDIYNVKNISISNKTWTIYSSVKPEK